MQPRLQLHQAGQQRQQALRRPALVGLAVRCRAWPAPAPGRGGSSRPSRCTGVLSASRPAFGYSNEPLLRHVELAAVAPVRVSWRSRRRRTSAAPGSACPRLLAGVLAPLQIPGALPLRPLAQAARLVPVRGQERHRLVGDQLRQLGGQVVVVTSAVESEHTAEISVGADAVGELRNGQHPGASGVAPQGLGFQPIEQPVPQRLLLLHLPRRGGPAALALRPLDERDVRPLLDDLNPPLDHTLVRLGPMRGNLGDRRGAVPREPLGLRLAGCHLAGQHDLEGPLAKVERWHGSPRARSGHHPAARRGGTPPSPTPPGSRSSRLGYGRTRRCALSSRRGRRCQCQRPHPAVRRPARAPTVQPISSCGQRWSKIGQRKPLELDALNANRSIQSSGWMPRPMPLPPLSETILLQPEAGGRGVEQSEQGKMSHPRSPPPASLITGAERLNTFPPRSKHKVVVRRHLAPCDRQRCAQRLLQVTSTYSNH